MNLALYSLKFLTISAVAAFTISIPSLAELPRFQYHQTQYPIAKTPAGDLYCYERTPQGQTIDLRELCGGRRQQPCDPAYPDVCIPPKNVRAVNCPELKAQGLRNIRVLPPDPQRLDGDKDGLGCE